MVRKYVFIISIFASGSIMAQNAVKIDASVLGGEAQIAPETVKGDVVTSTTGNQSQKKTGVSNRGNVDYKSHIRIGSSYYDLQSNYAMPHRLVLHPGGQVSACWTTSPNDVSGFPQRGTGFNFRNASGVWNKSDSTRADGFRTGWPNIGLLSDGREFVIGHEANQGGFYISKSVNPGDRPSGSTLILQETPFKPIWARMANNGDTIHMIYSYSDSSASGDVRAPLRKGVRAPMVYSRSLDGGVNWDIQHIMLPKYDSTITNNGGADQYAIDCRGNTVAVVNGDLLQGVIVWKSTDFGTTWTRMLADSFKYAPYQATTLMPDTPFTNDGTVDVLIDNSDKVHAFWGLGRVLDTDNTDQSYSFYPGLQGIVHWDEVSNNQVIVAAGAAFDRDADGFNQLQPETYAGLASGAPPSGMSTVARLGSTSAMRQPNAAIDAAGNIYCVFSVPIEGDISDLNANYRDIGVAVSEDDGATWSAEQNLTQVATLEDDFPTVARRANSFLHLMWQQDEFPGTNLQNNSTSFGNHPVILNKIVYQAIPTADIINGSIGMQYGLNTEEPNTGKVMIVSQNFPNPFSGITNITVYLEKPGDLHINVYNTTGNLVKSIKLEQLYRGNHQLEVDATGLPSGMYFYNITSGRSTATGSMIVK